MYLVLRTLRAQKDTAIGERAGFKQKLDQIKETLKENPYKRSQGFERLKNNLKDFCSRQIDIHNRVIYTVSANTINARDRHGNLYEGIVYIHSAWGHNYVHINK